MKHKTRPLLSCVYRPKRRGLGLLHSYSGITQSSFAPEAVAPYTVLIYDECGMLKSTTNCYFKDGQLFAEDSYYYIPGRWYMVVLQESGGLRRQDVSRVMIDPEKGGVKYEKQ